MIHIPKDRFSLYQADLWILENSYELSHIINFNGGKYYSYPQLWIYNFDSNTFKNKTLDNGIVVITGRYLSEPQS